MTTKEKQDLGVIAALVLIVAIIWWILRRKKQASETRPSSPGFVYPASAYWGNGNGPFAQGGGENLPQVEDTFTNYNIPIPNFGYSGNSQIYMPLFGFVGYSDVGTYG